MRKGLERGIQATETLVEGIDNTGVPGDREGDEAARLVSDWADSALDDLEEAQDSLDDEADSVEESIEQLTGAARRDRIHAGRGRRRSPTSPASTRSSPPRSRTRARASNFGRRRASMSTMDWVLVAVQGLVVIGFIALGVRSGGIGLGLWGGVGTLILVFVFGLDPGEPPISAILIIIAVISAAAAMEAAGGIDYMVKIASTALRARPKCSTSPPHTSRTSSRSSPGPATPSSRSSR